MEPIQELAHKGYRGPARAAMAGLLLLCGGGAVCAAAAAIVLAREGLLDSATFAYNLVVPFLGNRGKAIDDHSGFVTGILLLSSLAAGVGCGLLVIGGLWSVLRFQPRHRAVRTWHRLRPPATTAPALVSGASSGALASGAATGGALAPPSASGGVTAGDPLDLELS